MQAALESAARRAEAAGARVAELKFPELLERAHAAQFIIQDYETFCSYAFEYERHPDLISAPLLAQLEAGSKISADDYDAARRTASRGRQVFADLMGEHDVILTPSAPGAAPPGLSFTGNPTFNRLWTLMGAPCVNVPGLRDGALPLGVQVVGRFGRDRAALEAALFVERAIA
jgi:Asp-tRNA(Asn)/Glu-tRNA(Gln) amidotransferase A subunit family amidase